MVFTKFSPWAPYSQAVRRIICSSKTACRAVSPSALLRPYTPIGETGSVSFGFEQVGEIQFAVEAGDEEAVMDAAIEAGASDVESDEDGHFIYTGREDMIDVASALEAQFGELEAKSTKLTWKPTNAVPIAGEDADKLMKLLDLLDELDDVQNVYDNSELSDEEIERLGS